MAKITCFGEVLWDAFPTEKKIGGAPLNVASRLQSFNHNVSMISAIGKDQLGDKILSFLKNSAINTDCVQILSDYKTGEVTVTLNKKGSASYVIEHPSAWDKIQLTELSKKTVEESSVFVFGSLAARDEVSRETLYNLVNIAKYNVFDVNLRPPHYSKEILLHLMQKAHFIKFNDEELYEISGYLGSKYNSLEQNLCFMSKKTNTKHICVTKGQHGAVLLYEGSLYFNSGYQIKVVDTVGAGDSFLASIISQLQNTEDPQKAIDFACGVGALVAQKKGANPKISNSDIKAFVNPY